MPFCSLLPSRKKRNARMNAFIPQLQSLQDTHAATADPLTILQQATLAAMPLSPTSSSPIGREADENISWPSSEARSSGDDREALRRQAEELDKVDELVEVEEKVKESVEQGNLVGGVKEAEQDNDDAAFEARTDTLPPLDTTLDPTPSEEPTPTAERFMTPLSPTFHATFLSTLDDLSEMPEAFVPSTTAENLERLMELADGKAKALAIIAAAREATSMSSELDYDPSAFEPRVEEGFVARSSTSPSSSSPPIAIDTNVDSTITFFTSPTDTEHAGPPSAHPLLTNEGHWEEPRSYPSAEPVSSSTTLPPPITRHDSHSTVISYLPDLLPHYSSRQSTILAPRAARSTVSAAQSGSLPRRAPSARLSASQLVLQLKERLGSEPTFFYTLKGVLAEHQERMGVGRSGRGRGRGEEWEKMTGVASLSDPGEFGMGEVSMGADWVGTQTDEEVVEEDDWREVAKDDRPKKQPRRPIPASTAPIRPTPLYPSKAPHFSSRHPRSHPTRHHHSQAPSQLPEAFLPRSQTFLAAQAARAAQEVPGKAFAPRTAPRRRHTVDSQFPSPPSLDLHAPPAPLAPVHDPAIAPKIKMTLGGPVSMTFSRTVVAMEPRRKETVDGLSEARKAVDWPETRGCSYDFNDFSP